MVVSSGITARFRPVNISVQSHPDFATGPRPGHDGQETFFQKCLLPKVYVFDWFVGLLEILPCIQDNGSGIAREMPLLSTPQHGSDRRRMKDAAALLG